MKTRYHGSWGRMFKNAEWLLEVFAANICMRKTFHLYSWQHWGCVFICHMSRLLSLQKGTPLKLRHHLFLVSANHCANHEFDEHLRRRFRSPDLSTCEYKSKDSSSFYFLSKILKRWVLKIKLIVFHCGWFPALSLSLFHSSTHDAGWVIASHRRTQIDLNSWSFFARFQARSIALVGKHLQSKSRQRLSPVLARVHTGACAVTDAEKAEIVNRHNELRRGVDPPASNMLEMVSDV